MEAATAKRGVYPLHGYKIGLYRLPIKLEDPAEIQKNRSLCKIEKTRAETNEQAWILEF